MIDRRPGARRKRRGMERVNDRLEDDLQLSMRRSQDRKSVRTKPHFPISSVEFLKPEKFIENGTKEDSWRSVDLERRLRAFDEAKFNQSIDLLDRKKAEENKAKLRQEGIMELELKQIQTLLRRAGEEGLARNDFDAGLHFYSLAYARMQQLTL